MCGLHYMEAYRGERFTLPCPGGEYGLGCGRRHPLDELLTPMWEDPPPPPGLAELCDRIRAMHGPSPAVVSHRRSIAS